MATVSPAPPTAPLPSRRVGAALVAALAARVVTTGEREPMTIEQPFTGAPLGTVPKCAPEDLQAALERARAAQEAWGRTSFAER